MKDGESCAPDPTANGQADAAPSTGCRQSLREAIWKKLRWVLVRATALAGAFFLFAALLTAGAGWYTSRPDFCRSCHIMEPYYVSWQESTHHDVSCIKCHFPPGVGEKVRGKLLGLVQLAKYVTASEGPRPVAEIPDASCLRSGCHDTRTLSGRVEFHGMLFDHKPHMEKLRRGKKLRCTSCHSQIVQGSHMTVTTSTCFLCHFKEGVFNEGLGACTRCHQIPDQDFDLGGGVAFTHELAYERGVRCIHCHGDLIHGDGAVPPERCGVCHNRMDDLQRRDDHEFIHQKHVTDHKVDCLDCHLEIRHALDPHKIEHAASDCTSCHPDHHREQVRLLNGQHWGDGPSQDSSMTTVRVACPACHRMKTVSPTGSTLWKASMETCAECHEDATIRRIQSHNADLTSTLSSLQSEVERVRSALEKADLDSARMEELSKRLQDLDGDVEFLSVANGIHNFHYATTLTQQALEHLKSLCVELDIDGPRFVIPEW